MQLPLPVKLCMGLGSGQVAPHTASMMSDRTASALFAQCYSRVAGHQLPMSACSTHTKLGSSLAPFCTSCSLSVGKRTLYWCCCGSTVAYLYHTAASALFCRFLIGACVGNPALKSQS
jgi:hypothetical protein